MLLSSFLCPQYNSTKSVAPIASHRQIRSSARWTALLTLALLAFPLRGLADSAISESVSFSSPGGLFAGKLSLTLTGARENQTIRYTLTAPSAAGAEAPEPSATSSAYVGPIELESSVIVRAAVFADDDLSHGPSATAQYVRYADSGSQRLDNFSSNLPLLVLDNHGLGAMQKDGIDRLGWIYGFSAGSGNSALGAGASFALPLEFAVRGNASAAFQKKSFKLKLLNTAGKKQAIAPFGLGNFDKWQLIGPWGYDPSFIRNAFMYELSNRIGLWAPRTRFVEVFINGDSDGLTAQDYAGIYVLTDKIEPKEGRVAIADLEEDEITEPKVSGGYIFKVDWADEDDYTWTTEGGVTLILDTPDVDDIVPEQAYYLEKYVQQFESALFRDIATGWSERAYLNFINRDTWIDFHLLNTFAKNSDAFQGSTFFTKDRNGKLSAGPLWDFDRSMGSTDPRNVAWNEWRSVEDGGDGWYSQWWGKLVLDPDFMQGWIDRWQTLRDSTFSNTALTGLATELAAGIGEAAAKRDIAAYPGNESRYVDGYDGEIARLKEWLTNRAQWIDAQFSGPPTIVKQGGQITITPAPGTTLVYTLDGSDPRRSGGTIASAAQQTDNPLVLPDHATFSARSRNSGTVKFPATPWSAAVTVIGTGAPPPPTVSTLPNIPNTTIAAGHATAFSAGDVPGSIQWQISTDKGVTWTNLSDNADYSGATTNTLTVKATRDALDGAHFRYTTAHLGTTYTSNSATLTVVPVFFPFPTGIAADSAGNLFVADANSNLVGAINLSGQVRTLAGKGSSAVFNRPEGLIVLPDGGLAVADSANDSLRTVTASGGVAILAGRPGARGSTDGPAAGATFSDPKDVARTPAGAIIVADAMNHVIRRIAPNGMVTTLAGTAGSSGIADGNGAAARFNYPSAVTADAQGNLFVADTTNNAIRKISPTGDVTTLAGLPGVTGFDDGKGNAALFNRPGGLVVDGSGNLFVADTGNSTIRKVTPDGTVTTLAGIPGIAGVENGPGGNARFNHPQDLARDNAGNLFVADTGNALIRKITPAGEVSILALSAAPISGNDGGSNPVNPPIPPATTSGGNGGGGGGGGGAPSWGFMLALGLLTLHRIRQLRSLSR